ncbi:hypothetical protein A8H40_04100 [Burkholderia multivorans]|nr:hypothetical protein A8H40_04100 [Burkholderia multivorans]EJO52151.1 hypothetical protein BURMUCF1_A0231 [Burkholderia multivorans ATCC BAA-247]PRG97786.1 hypothetical protein C6T60_28550 [Burkholderia multivorans]
MVRGAVWSTVDVPAIWPCKGTLTSDAPFMPLSVPAHGKHKPKKPRPRQRMRLPLRLTRVA